MRAAYAPLLLLLMLGGCDDDATPKADAAVDAKTQSDEPRGAFSSYKAKSQASEAKVQINSIASGIRMRFTEEVVDPESMQVSLGNLPPSAPMTPAAGSCCKQPGGTCPPEMGDWTHEGWKAVMFEPSSPHRYSYEIVVEGKQKVTVRAVGDLDCDGKLSTYESVGTVVDGGLEFAPSLVEIDPLE